MDEKEKLHIQENVKTMQNVDLCTISLGFISVDIILIILGHKLNHLH